MFLCGAFGTLVMLIWRGLPSLNWFGRQPDAWLMWLILIVVGGIATCIWGDEEKWRAFIFGATVGPVLAAVVRG